MRQRGATLALVVAVSFVIVLVGVGIFWLSRLFGGARELQALTDSGTLNLGKQMVTVGVPLNTNPQLITFNFMNQYWVGFSALGTPASVSMTLTNGVEGANFPYLTDQNGNITLENYNRVIAQTMLVGFNAQAERTMPAAANAQLLFDAVQRDSTSLSQRLGTKLADAATASNIFQNTGMANSLRMLGASVAPTFASNQFATGYYSPGATNVWLDPSLLPSGITMPAGALSNVNGPTNFPYLNGYTDIDAGPFSTQGAAVFPTQQPHLVSLRDFNFDLSAPIAVGYVAPNSFQAGSTAPSFTSDKALNALAASVVGVLGVEYPAGIPEGFVMVQNWDGGGGPLSSVLTNVSTADQATIVANLTQRIHQILPTATTAQIEQFVNNIPVNASFKVPTYVYLYPQPSSPAYAAWHAQVLASGMPDGTPGQLYASSVPPPTMVVPPEGATWGTYADGPMQMFLDKQGHHYEWMPSSGFDCFLGALEVP